MKDPGEREDIEEMLAPQVHPKKIIKETKIHEYKGQYSIKLPKLIMDELDIKKNDLLIIEYDTETKEYLLKFKKKNDKEKITSNR